MNLHEGRGGVDIWEGYGQKFIQKHPKIELSAAIKAFEFWKLGKSISHIYETWPRYLPTQELKIEGVKEWAGEGCIQINTKTWHEINNISTLTSPNNTLENAIKVRIILIKPLKI